MKNFSSFEFLTQGVLIKWKQGLRLFRLGAQQSRNSLVASINKDANGAHFWNFVVFTYKKLGQWTQSRSGFINLSCELS